MGDTFTQTTYGEQRIGSPGDLIDSGPSDPVTCWAMEAGLLPGTWARLDPSASDPSNLHRPGVRNLRVNRLTFTFGADTSTGTFAGTLKRVKLDGTTTTHAISVGYATSHTNTMNLIKAAFDAIGAGSGADVLATLTDSTNNRQVTVTSVDPSTTLSASVAFAWSTPTTPTTTTNNASTDVPNVFIGNDWTMEKDINGLVKYDQYADVPCQRMGRALVDAETTLPASSGTTPGVYARIYPDTGTNQEQGKTRSSAGSSPTIAVQVPTTLVWGPTDTAHKTAVVDFNFKGT